MPGLDPGERHARGLTVNLTLGQGLWYAEERKFVVNGRKNYANWDLIAVEK